MGTFLLVHDKVRNIERKVTKKAYSLIPKRYKVIGELDDNTNELLEQPQAKNTATVVKKNSQSPVATDDVKVIPPVAEPVPPAPPAKTEAPKEPTLQEQIKAAKEAKKAEKAVKDAEKAAAKAAKDAAKSPIENG